MLALPGVTLCCVDTRTPELALQALTRCTQGIRFADVVLFTDASCLAMPVPQGVRVVPVDIDCVAAYSEFMLKGLVRHVQSPHVLVVQWDGFVLDPQAWDPAFLSYDYIGPPWVDFPEERAVGNGGFSLRSRALLQALADPAITASHPEDLCICHEHRVRLEEAHGIRFAPPGLAARFGFERGEPAEHSFGFHGLFNFHRVMSSQALHAFLLALPPALTAGRDGKDLCKALIRVRQLSNAGLLLRKRFQVLGLCDGHTLRLALRLAWAWLRRRPSPHA